jgi:hypothetical protein
MGSECFKLAWLAGIPLVDYHATFMSLGAWDHPWTINQ